MAPIQVSAREGVASITLSSPERGNALTPELVAALTQAIEEAERDTACRVIVLSAVGASFCQGADFNALFTPEGKPNPAYPELFLRCLLTVRKASRPVIACVDGRVTGGGVGLVAACDLVIAAPTATFVLPEVLVGMIPALITPFLLRRLQPAHVRALTLSARSIGALEAQRLGLVDEVGEEGLERAVKSQVERLFRASPAALQESKAYFERLQGDVMREQTDLAVQRLLGWLGRADVAEGIRSYAEGFSPPWFQKHKGTVLT